MDVILGDSKSKVKYGSTANTIMEVEDSVTDGLTLERDSRFLDSWIRRTDTMLDDNNELRSFFGEKDEALVELIRKRRTVADITRSEKKKDYLSLNRALIDTPVWNRQKLAILDMRKGEVIEKRNSSLFYRLLSWCDANFVGPIDNKRKIVDSVIIVVIGVSMAIVGYVVSKSADNILDLKIEMAYMTEKQHEGWGQFVFIGLSGVLAFMAFLPVAFRPIISGSGLDQAKAVLNGIDIPTCTAGDTMICKGLSVVMAVAAGFPAGLEGPLIHLGLCIGDNANRLVPRHDPSLNFFRSQRAKTDFASVGAAAGVAIAFRSPIGGVLFAMEEGSSFWSVGLTWRCFAAACTSVIALYIIIGYKTGFMQFNIRSMALFNGINEAMLNSGSSDNGYGEVPSFVLGEYLIFLLIGAVGGVLGAIFNELNRSLTIWRRKMNFSLRFKAFEVIFLAMSMAALCWYLPLIFSECKSLEQVRTDVEYFRQHNCPEGQYNELASLLINPFGAVGVNLLFHESVDAFSIKACMIAGVVNFLVLLVVFGIFISAGIFIPLLYIGACFGRALAIYFHLNPTSYSVIGAAAMLGGVVRVLISITTIIVHTTYLSHFITPVMLVTIMARQFGNATFNRPGIYDIILSLKGIPFLEEEAPPSARHETIRARDIMAPVKTLPSVIQVEELLNIIRDEERSDFIVVDTERDDRLLGIISRMNLLSILRHTKIFNESKSLCVTNGGASPVAENVLTHQEIINSFPLRNHVAITLEKVEHTLSSDDKNKYLHLTPYVQLAPHTFDGHGSAERAYEMFRTLGLRTLLVLDNMSRPIGAITRIELLLLEHISMSEEKFLKEQYHVGSYHVS